MSVLLFDRVSKRRRVIFTPSSSASLTLLWVEAYLEQVELQQLPTRAYHGFGRHVDRLVRLG